MNVYSMISKTGGNKKTSTLSIHREATGSLTSQDQNFLSHPFLSWQLRLGCGHRSTWSSDPFEVNVWSRMTLLLTAGL